MKKTFLVVAIAMFSFVSADASHFSLAGTATDKFISKRALQYDALKANPAASPRGLQGPVFKCVVVLKYKSANVDVVVSFTGNSCAEAWAAASKTVHKYAR